MTTEPSHTGAADPSAPNNSDAGISDETIAVYRQHLVAAEQKSQEEYDKAALTLSGGALGVSFAFVKDLVGPSGVVLPGMLVAAWMLWAASIVAVLASYYVSRLALRKAIVDCDNDNIRKPTCTPGGYYTTALRWLNGASGVLFLAGVVSISVFVFNNIPKERAHGEERHRQGQRHDGHRTGQGHARTAPSARASEQPRQERRTQQTDEGI